MHEVWGQLLKITLWTDSSSGKVMAIRRGVGRTRHLEVWQCYIQAITNSGRVKVMKVLGTKNVADAGTKPVDKVRVEEFMLWLGIIKLQTRGLGGTAVSVSGLVRLMLAATLPVMSAGVDLKKSIFVTCKTTTTTTLKEYVVGP